MGNDADRLTGWKEIADHLRRSVRSVQRWEHELKLPVHRVKTLNGHVVYASRRELDMWLDSVAALPAVSADATSDSGEHAEYVDTDDATATAAPPSRPVAPEDRTGQRRRAPRWMTAGFALAVIAGTLAFRQWAVPVSTAETRFVFNGRTLEARDPSGDLVWAHPFEQDVEWIQLSSLRNDSVSMADVDLNGDGRVEHLVIARMQQDLVNAGDVDDILLSFSDQGKVLWSLSGDRVLTCGGQAYAGPWRIKSVTVSGDAGRRRVWVSFVHHTWWPSFVMEVSPEGAQALRYVQAGWVQTLAEWRTPQGNVLVAGGVLNEWERGSVALIDTEGPASMLPASDAHFACDVADTVPPRSVTLLPQLDIFGAYGHAYGLVERVSVQGSELKVELNGSFAVGMLSAQGEITTFRVSDTYRVEHDLLAETKRLGHFFGACPELVNPREVRRWTPAESWRIGEVAPAIRRLAAPTKVPPASR